MVKKGKTVVNVVKEWPYSLDLYGLSNQVTKIDETSTLDLTLGNKCQI